MPASDDWTDADFVPREGADAGGTDTANREQRERMEWFRCEIRSRLGAAETQAQVVAWLVTLGCDPGAAVQLVTWARTAPPYHPPASETGGSPVICVETRYESGEVVTDPVASARARAAARKQRTRTGPEAPAPEFEFAQPADSAQVRLARGDSRAWVWLVVGLLVAAAVVVTLVAVARE